ncbi:MAG: PHP domain-containing protein [Armatimonadota bacterium]
MKADLHVHTTASDGTLSPEEVVREAARLGLGGIGITDHDSVQGVAPALAEGERVGVTVVPGIEINTDYADSELHILGYWIETESPALQAHLRTLREAREERGRMMVEKLNELGCRVSFERVRELAGGVIGRPHVARAIVEAGCTRDMNGAFGRFLVRGAPAYIPRYKITPFEAVRIIREAGGVAVLAHPGNTGHDEVIPELVEAGMRGIEVYHTDHNRVKTARYRRLAQQLGLIATGGSDFHGPGMLKQVPLGHVRVDMLVVYALRDAALSP